MKLINRLKVTVIMSCQIFFFPNSDKNLDFVVNYNYIQTQWLLFSSKIPDGSKPPYISCWIQKLSIEGQISPGFEGSPQNNKPNSLYSDYKD